jgi:hypothetical protein
MTLPENGALFGDTRPLGLSRSAAGVDTGTLPRVDPAAGFAALVGMPEPACWRAALPAGLLACCAPTELAVLGAGGAPPALVELLVRRLSSRPDAA